MSKVWFITGAGSGIGAATARAALKAGDKVVATGRNLDKVHNALRDVASESVAFVQLDVANEAQAKAAAEEAVKTFGRIDALLNNAGYSLLGNFEELTTAEIDGLISTNLYGVIYAMRAVLPVMRKQRWARSSISVRLPKSWASSTAVSLALPSLLSRTISIGVSRSRTVRHQAYGGRAGFLSEQTFFDAQNAKYGNSSIDDYAVEGTAKDMWSGYDGKQQGDPAKLADVLVKIAGMENPPHQLVAGSDALAAFAPALKTRLEELRAHVEMSNSTDGSF